MIKTATLFRSASVIGGILLWLLCLSLTTLGQDLRWAQQFNGTDDVTNTDMAVDAAGNSYLTGLFQGTADFDPGPGSFSLTSAGGSDVYIVKLTARGEFVWARQLGGTGNDGGFRLKLDASGNPHLVGYISGIVNVTPWTTATTFNSADGAGFIMKLTPSGGVSWVKQSTDDLSDIAVDGSGNVYTAGTINGTFDFDPGSASFTLVNTTTTARDIFVQKLTSLGNFVWAKHMKTTLEENIAYRQNTNINIAVDGQGNPYLTGLFKGTVDFDPGTSVFELTREGGRYWNIFIAKLTASGNFVWAKQIKQDPSYVRYSVPPSDEITFGASPSYWFDIAVDEPGNAVVTGGFSGTAVDFDPGPDSFTLTSRNDNGNTNDMFVLKLNPSGDLSWVRQFKTLSAASPQSVDIASQLESVVLDPTGNVYIFGTYGGTVDFDPGPGTFSSQVLGAWDLFICKLDTDGDFGWVRTFEGNASHLSRVAGAVDADGNIYVHSTFQRNPTFSTVDVDPGPGTYFLDSPENFNIAYVVRLDVFLLTAGASSLSVCAGSTASLSVSVTGGTQPYSYTWSAPAGISLPANTNTSALSGTISAGITGVKTLTVTVAGQGGIPVSSTTISLTVNAAPSLTITANPSLTITNGSTGTLIASGGVSYSWSSGQSTSAISVTAGGTYSVTGTTSGCSSTTSATITTTSPTGSFIWDGSSSTDWNTPANWSTNLVPTATDDVVIVSTTATTGFQPVIGAGTAALAKSVEVRAGAALTIATSGTLTINDSKSVSGFVSAAFYNRGSIVNNGRLVIGNLANAGYRGVLNWGGSFINNSGGAINIDRTIVTGLYNYSGGTFVNAGAITMGASATIGGWGFFSDGGSFTNTSGGSIKINRSSDTGLACFNRSTFVNSGTISVGASATVGFLGMLNSSSSFSNTSEGFISLNNASNISLRNFLASTFVNSGTISVGASTTVLSGLDNHNASFINTSEGHIRLDRLTDQGIDNTNSSTFVNAGGITISMETSVTVGSVGLQNYDRSIFDNAITGHIHIDGLTDRGLINAINSAFVNSGTLTVGASIGTAGISNQASFTNSACASLSLLSPVNNTSALTNNGFITVSTTQSHTNTGTLTNNGIISYPLGNPIPTVTNNDLIVVPFISCSPTALSALQLGGSTSFSAATTWYTNASLTQVAGTYNQATNTFTGSNMVAGNTYLLSFSVTDNGCGRVISTSITVNGMPSLTVTASPNGTLTCGQTSLTLTATGGNSYTFTRTGGGGIVTQNASTGTAVVNASGVYSVTATNAVGCAGVTTTTVYSNTTSPALSLSPSSATLTCGSPTVTLTATAGLTSYSFSTGQTGSSNTLVVSANNVYLVTATGPNGCTALASTTITSSTAVPTVSIQASSTVLSCSSPTVSLSAIGVGSVLWSTGASTSVISASVATTYSVTLTNANGCSAVGSITIGSSTSAPSLSVTPGSATLTCSSPTVLLTAIGGGGVRWSTGASTPVISVSAANTYSVTLTGSNGCTAVASAVVVSSTAAPSLSINASTTVISCANPTVSLSAIGTGSVLWSTGASTSVISATAAGTYSVVLTNSSGCTATTSVMVSSSLLGNVSVSADGPLGCGVVTTTVRVQAVGATSFTLVGPNGYNQSNPTGVFTVVAGGSYTALAGQSGCVVSGTVTVVEGGVQPTISSVAASGSLGAGSCTVSVSAAGLGDRYVLTGPSGYVYSVVYRTAAERVVSFPSVVKPGAYTLTVYSGNCVVSRSLTVSGTACP